MMYLFRKFNRSFLKVYNKEIAKWIESIVISISLPVIGYAIDSSDPFFVTNQFPWLVLAPLFIGLKYGLACGLLAASLLTGMVTAGFFIKWWGVPFFPKEMIVGMLLITLISTEFHGFWTRKLMILKNEYDHMNARMDKFTRAYQLLKGSHHQLEQYVTNQTRSLRSILVDLERKTQTLENKKGEPLAGVGEDILLLFSNLTNIQIAAVYAVINDEQNKINPEPVASLGSAFSLPSSDPLVKEALRTGLVTSINLEADYPENTVVSLVVIPLVDIDQKIWGLVVVNEMPLFEMHKNNLDLFAILGGNIGDLIKQRSDSTRYIDNKAERFEPKLRRVLMNIELLKSNAIIIGVFISPGDLQVEYLARFQANLRGVDKIWILKDDEQNSFSYLILLPYTNEKGAHEFLKRISISELLSENVSNGLHCKTFSRLDGNNNISMWILDNKTSAKKVMLDIQQLL